MSGRDRDRRAAASARTNEYFVPKDGIDREVITADICRYLGNDALVRPGVYESRQGYYINAYRNLTSEMIADLKADSLRWENERRLSATRGQPTNVGYRESNTHQSRQYYGPSEAQPAGAPGYSTGTTTGNQVVYEAGPSYQQNYSQQPAQNYGAQPGPSYAQPGTYGTVDNNYYAGGNLGIADSSRTRVPISQSGINVPRTIASDAPYPGTPYQGENRSYYQAQPGPPVSSAQTYTSQPPQEPYYRAPPPTDMYSAQEPYDNHPNYQDNGYSAPQSQPSISQSTTAAVPNTGTRREHNREPDTRDNRNRRR